ncbi:hypothetical protein J437_LFUL012565 [Ladona fulva]|uniref:DUF4781 domain-containing protein n=1 Tax=Ladona fulva TaxID=123851 RepID=A0A8K0KFV9_LADFU|nr:hypothetical protein J437_LFUL012565 [Ladona fulva]
MDDWMERALQLQQDLCEKLEEREWDLFKSNQRWALESKVAFAMFGEPKSGKSDYAFTVFSDIQVSNYYESCLRRGYTEEQRGEIKRICDKIYETTKTTEILIAFLFVIGNCDSNLYIQPIFRVKKYSGKIKFIDFVGRVYKSWLDYKESNQLPAGKVLYPAHGIYYSNDYGKVMVECDKTPASTDDSNLLAECDNLAGMASIFLTGVGIASLFIPVVGPVATVARWAYTGYGIYGLARGSSTLLDRQKHAQSISLSNSENFSCWLSVLGGAFGIGNGLAMKGMVAAVASGKEVSKVGQVMVNFLNYGALTVNGVGVAYNFGVLVDKANKDELTSMDFLQFSTSLLFFTNSAMNAKTASAVIEQVQKETISNFNSDLSKKRAKAYAKLVRKSGGDGTMEGRARLIKGITNVGSKDEYFRMIIRGQKQSSFTLLNDKGNLMVDGKAYVDTDVRLQTHVRINPCVSNTTPFTSSYSEQDTMVSKTMEISVKMMQNICKKNNKEFIHLEDNIKIALSDLVEYFHRLFKQYFSSKGKTTFPSNKVIDFINTSEEFAKSRGCKTKEGFMTLTRFLCIYQKNRMKLMESDYQKEKRKAMELMGEKFNESVFACKWGVQDVNERESSFLETINDKIQESMIDLKQKYEQFRNEIYAINMGGGLKFLSNDQALDEYFHCFVIDGEVLTPEDFFSIIRNVINDENSIKYYEGNGVIKYQNEMVLAYVKHCKEVRYFITVNFLNSLFLSNV